jgi:hypothetical protein|tara:strand:+ start:1228 stop:3186 length:1959 start_codon:yes stop_codon:yes gene_type:complete
MSGISIDLDVFNEIDDEVFLAPELENLATEEAKRVYNQALTGNRKNPVERLTDFVSDPVGNVLNPVASSLVDTGSGVLTGLAGIGQLSALTTETAKQGLAWLQGEEYTDEQKQEFIEKSVTEPEIARQAAYANYREKVSSRKPSAIAGFIGEVIPTVIANPQKAAQGFFGKTLQSMFYGGLSGSMEFAEGGSQDRAMNTMIGVASGGAFDILQQVGRKAYQISKEAFSPSIGDFAQTDKIDVAETLSKSDVKTVIRSAGELGITVTPAEASGDMLLVHGQNTLNINQASREQLSEFLTKRNDSLTENILSLQKIADGDLQYTGATFSPSSETPFKAPFVTKVDEVKWKKTREDVYRQTLETEEMKAVFGASPMLSQLHNSYQKALKKPPTKRTNADVIKITAFTDLKKKLNIEGSMPINNVGYLDMLITNLDDLLEQTAEITTKGARDQALISNQRKALSGVLKRRVEGYESLKNQQQRALAVSNLQKAVDVDKTRSEDYAEAFYNNILKNTKKREELLRQLATDPTAQKKVNDLTLVMSHIFSDANVSKLVKGTEKDLAAMGTGGLGTLGAIGLKFRELVRNDAGLINVITNPQWTSDISKLKGRTADETLQNLTSFLSRVVNTSDKIETALGQKQTTREDLMQAVSQRTM